MREPTLYATDHYLVTECDECHIVATCMELDEPNGGGLEVCSECFKKLDSRGHIAHDD